MTVLGLENNYYLTQNDIWVTINGFTEIISKVMLDFKNIGTNQQLNGFECSSSPSNDCYFNVCFPIRALMPEPDHINNNSLQSFEIKITTKFKNTSTPDQVQTLTRYFIRGGRNKKGTDEWYLTDGASLTLNYWIIGGVSWTALTPPVRISGGILVPDETYSKTIQQAERKNCDGILIKYLNSLGAYQYFYFDRYELKNKTKASKSISRITGRLRKDNFQNIGYEETKTMTLFAWTEKLLQPNFEELVKSIHILYYDPHGNDNDSSWYLIKLDDNSSVINNYENVYENKIEFTLPNYRTLMI